MVPLDIPRPLKAEGPAGGWSMAGIHCAFEGEAFQKERKKGLEAGGSIPRVAAGRDPSARLGDERAPGAASSLLLISRLGPQPRTRR